MSARAVLAALIGATLSCASPASALDYELWAERPGADAPTVMRMGQPFPSYHDCLEAIALWRAEKGWRLRCRPAEVAPVPRLSKADR